MQSYFSFSDGTPAGVIRNGRYSDQVLYVTDQLKLANVPPSVTVDYKRKKNRSIGSSRDFTLTRGQIEPMPNPDKRDVIYIAGPSGCGKSMFSAMYMENFRRLWPEKSIYLFSRLTSDPSLDHVKNLTRIALDGDDESLLGKVDGEMLANSLVVFDDCDTIRNVKMRQMVMHIKDDLLQTGRHQNIYMIITSHLINNSKQTRIIMQELNKIVLFPGNGASYFTRYYLKNYAGLDKRQIQRMLNVPSRWVMLHMHTPRYIMFQTGGYML